MHQKSARAYFKRLGQLTFTGFLNLSSSSLPTATPSCITASRLSSIKSVNCAHGLVHARRFISAASLLSSKLCKSSRARDTLQQVKTLEVRTCTFLVHIRDGADNKKCIRMLHCVRKPCPHAAPHRIQTQLSSRHTAPQVIYS